PSGGVLVPRGCAETQAWPEPVREYDPVPQADEILTHVTRLKVDDSRALLEFVNQWGPLGLSVAPDVYARLGIWISGRSESGEPSVDPFYEYALPRLLPAEPVYWLQKALTNISLMAHALHELQRWRPGRPDTTIYGWHEFADRLNGMIASIRRAAR